MEDLKDTGAPITSQKSQNLWPIYLLILMLILIIGSLKLIGVGPERPIIAPPAQKTDLVSFKDEADFKAYLETVKNEASAGFGFGGNFSMGRDITIEGPLPVAAGKAETSVVLDQSASRVSGTNVQVLGIDEPDILKVDAQHLYYSRTAGPILYNDMRIMAAEGKMMPIAENPGKTTIINAFPPETAKWVAEIAAQGDLLLSGTTLIVFLNNEIRGFDVSNTAVPKELWTMSLSENGYRVEARLYNNKLYLITSSGINFSSPCPISPITFESKAISIACPDIYHPIRPISADVIYTFHQIEPQSGSVEKSTAFVASSGDSIVYMSPSAIYLTYSFTGDYFSYLADFFSLRGKDLVSSDLIAKISTLQHYDLSNGAKLYELQQSVEKYFSSLSEDERRRIENEYQNRLSDYSKTHSRDLERTGIAKIDANNLAVAATGEVSGRPLNQFALDEYENHLRIATTVSGNMFGGGESVNDVYILDTNLRQTGSVLDLGVTERIYSVRFVGELGYVVTFRQIDPFYVLDLSNPSSPQKKGELKIPGFSSYLHPLSKTRILGIGRDGQKVKVSLFDVASPETPQELDVYVLDEYWSEALDNHHAFLYDEKHHAFFMPGGQGGYVFTVVNDTLSLAKALSSYQIKRAAYLSDYLYIVGDNKITILSENNWETVKELDL